MIMNLAWVQTDLLVYYMLDEEEGDTIKKS